MGKLTFELKFDKMSKKYSRSLYGDIKAAFEPFLNISQWTRHVGLLRAFIADRNSRSNLIPNFRHAKTAMQINSWHRKVIQTIDRSFDGVFS